jgi:hypothetical protein
LGELDSILSQPNANVNERGACNRTALHKAVGKGFLDCVEYLVVDKQADVNVVDDGGLSAL